MTMTKVKFILFLAAVIVLATGCGRQQERPSTSDSGGAGMGSLADVRGVEAAADSTIYGLACDGCNDTIVVFLRLPYNGSDPDTLNILEASHQHRVFGTPMIGDRLAIMRNSIDTTKADQMIVVEDLLGLWCYKVRPTLRQRADMEGQSVSQSISQLPDSIRELLEVEREYGMTIKNDSVVYPHGMQWVATTTDEETPIEYPRLKRYFVWYIHNGQLILTETARDSLGNAYATNIDTAAIAKLDNDTLVLRFADGEQSYYHKDETAD